METYEAVVLAVVAIIVLVLIVRASKNKSGYKSHPLSDSLHKARAENGLDLQMAVDRKSDPSAWGPSRPSAREARYGDNSFRTRNGHYIHPDVLSSAEQQAWVPSNPYAAPMTPSGNHDEHNANIQEGDWNQRLSDFAVDAETRANHREWADNVGPYSQTAMAVDDLDEQVALGAVPRQGITAFRALAVPQGPCTHQITEVGPQDHVEHLSRFDF